MSSETESAWWYCQNCHQRVSSYAETVDQFKAEVVEHAGDCLTACRLVSCHRQAETLNLAMSGEVEIWCWRHHL